MSKDQESSPAAEASTSPIPPAAPSGAPRRRGLWFLAFLVFLALLLGAAALALGAWQWDTQRRQVMPPANTAERLEALEALAQRAPDQRLGDALRDMEQTRARLGGIDARIDMLETRDEALARRVTGLGSADRQDWALAQAEYLERLANQSLLMGREAQAALDLLRSADEVLRSIDDPALYAARAALGRDIASLREIAGFDVEGIYVRLAALAGRIPTLTLLQRTLPPAFGAGTEAPPAAVDQRWWSRITALLERLVVVRHRNESARPLLPLAEESQLRMMLRLGIEQAKLALLATEPRIYRDALGEVRALAADTLASGDGATRAFIAELDALAAIDIAPALPDISGSLHALRAHVLPATAEHEASVPEAALPAAPEEPPAAAAPPAAGEP